VTAVPCRVLLVLALCLGLTSSCGEDVPDVAPAKVSLELVPPTLLGGSLRLEPDDKTSEVFKSPGPRGLIADGRIFTVRGAGDRLVGALQLSTFRPDVDLSDERQRNKIVAGIVTREEKISVGAVEVVQSSTPDKTMYVWFGEKTLHVLQLKPNKAVPFEPDDVLAEFLTYETAQPTWRPLSGQDGLQLESGEEEDPG
jgi:hypothetical protein